MSNLSERIDEIRTAAEGKGCKDAADYAIRLITSCRPGHTETVYYEKYISDNELFMNELRDLLLNHKEGTRISIYSPCGSGKTVFSLSELPKLDPDAIIVQTVPNNIQANQNAENYADIEGEKRYAVPVTGESGKNIQLMPGSIYTFVYDCIGHLTARLTEAVKHHEDLHNLTFIIDEAHLLIAAEHYRKAAIENLKKVADLVLKLGGIVIIMTGTPDKLLGVHLDYEYTCMEMREGKVIPAFNFQKLELIQKNNKDVNIEAFMVQVICDCIDAGEIPFVRFNDKKVLERVAAALRNKGYRVYVFSSDKKGFCMDVDPETGCSVRRFDDPAYGKIQEEDSLPFADAYLTTSLLEVGTSIRFVEDANGVKQQPINLTPIYFCNRTSDFDLDSMIQFFSRPRFPIGHAIVAMNMTEYRSKTSGPLKSRGECILEAVDANIMKIGADGRCFMTPGVGNASKEDGCLVYDENGFAIGIDPVHLFAAADLVYSEQGYKNPEKAEELLRENFRDIEITAQVITKIEKISAGRPALISDEQKEMIRAACFNPECMKAVTRRNGFDRKNADLNRLDSDPVGKKASLLMRQFGRSGRFNSQELYDIVVSELTRPGKPVSLSDGGKIVNPKLAAEKYSLLKISEMEPSKQRLLYEYLKNLLRKKTDREDGATEYETFREDDISCYFTDEEMNWVDSITGSESFEKIVKALIVFCSYYTIAKLPSFFQSLAQSSGRDYVEWINRTMRAMRHNQIIIGSKALRNFRAVYEKEVAFRQSRFDAEYQAIIRNEGSLGSIRMIPDGLKGKDGERQHGWNYPDRKYRNLPEEEREQHCSQHYTDGFIGQSLTRYDIEQIARQMPQAVRKLCRTKEPLHYTEEDIRRLICTIYSTRTIGDPSGKGDYRIQVVGLRKQMPKSCGWAEMSESEAIDAVEDIVIHDSISEQGNSDGDVRKIRQIEEILRKYTFLGASADSSRTLQNAVGWLTSTMKFVPQSQQMFCYIKGQLKTFVDLEKMRVDYNRRHLDQPDTRPVRMEDVITAKAIGKFSDWDEFITKRKALVSENTLADGVHQYRILNIDTGKYETVTTDDPTLMSWLDASEVDDE